MRIIIHGDVLVSQGFCPVTTEGTTMLYDPAYASRLSEFDQQVFRVAVPKDHFLRKTLECIPWHDFDELLAPYCCPDKGRPPNRPS